MIHAAILNFYLASLQGKRRCPTFSVEVTSEGRLNLHKFDEKLRAQFKGYLVRLGVLIEQQVFEAEVTTLLKKLNTYDLLG